MDLFGKSGLALGIFRPPPRSLCVSCSPAAFEFPSRHL